MNSHEAIRVRAAAVLAGAIVASISSAQVASAATSYSEARVHGFAENSAGIFPRGPLVADSSGALYGSTTASGTNGKSTIFKLTPPASGQTAWAFRVIYSSPTLPNTSNPITGITIDGNGVIYGITTYSKLGDSYGDGTVFSLTPPLPGHSAWTQKTIHQFTSAVDGNSPAGILLGNNGALYVETLEGGPQTCGTVVKLTPPALGKIAWSESILHAFAGSDGCAPTGGLTQGAGGTIYGATSDIAYERPDPAVGHGKIFQLMPPGTGSSSWTHTVLYRFSGKDGDRFQSAVYLDANRTLYGTTGGSGGSVFMLAPPSAGSAKWQKTNLYTFKDGKDGASPSSGVVPGKSGGLFGVTAGGGSAGHGTVYQVLPPTVGQKDWTEKVLYSFRGNLDGLNPAGNLLIADSGVIFGATSYGGSYDCNVPGFPGGCGTVFQLSPTETAGE